MKRIFVSIDYGFVGGTKTRVIEVPDNFNKQMINEKIKHMIDMDITWKWEDITSKKERG